MKPDTKVVLGDFTFSSFEVPESIPFGGKQAIAVQKLIGGRRVLDAMGRDDDDLSWSGLFLGTNAQERARYLDYLRVAGKPLRLQWAEFQYTVLIEQFRPIYLRAYEIPYSITCTIAEDLAKPITQSPAAPIDPAIQSDMAAATNFGDLIGDSTLSSLLGTLGNAVGAVSSFAKAAQSTINGVLGPLAAVQSRVTTLIGTTGSTLSNVTSLGGILPNNPISQQTAGLAAQVNGFTQMPILLNLQSTVGRMGMNLGSVLSAGKTIATAGGDLYTLASKYYGDASAWTTIARANNITDPNLPGVNNISVPLNSDQSGGVYGG